MYSFLRRHAIVALALAVFGIAGLRTGHVTAALTRVSPYLTRAEAAAIVMLASPAPLPRVADPYVDVLPDDWFAPSILAAAKIGALSPDETGTRIRPFKPVNRATFLKMLSLAFGLPAHQKHSFADVAPDAWYAPYAGVDATYALFRHADASLLEPDRLVTQDEAKWAMEAFLRARTQAENKADKGTAVAQVAGKVQLYTIISTKRLRVVLVGANDRHAAATTPAPVANPTTEEVRGEVLELVNAERAKEGLPHVNRNVALERSAQAYADQMDHDGFFGHVDPKGKTLKDRIDAVGFYSRDFSADCQCIKGYALAENLARGQRTAKEAVQAWMDSPSHRDAILGSDFTDLGVGVRSGVWVEHFGGLLTPDKE